LKREIVLRKRSPNVGKPPSGAEGGTGNGAVSCVSGCVCPSGIVNHIYIIA
jgi:hypothetical protein